MNSKNVKIVPTEKVKPIKIPKTRWYDFKTGVLAINCTNYIVARLFLIFCNKQGIPVDSSYDAGVSKAWKQFNADIAFVYDTVNKKVKCNDVNKYRKETYEIYKIG